MSAAPPFIKSTASTAVPQSLLAFDFGLRRTGVAVGNAYLKSAQPVASIHQTGDARFDAIAKLIKEWQPDALVIGVPFHPDGAEHEMTAHARRFGRQLKGRFHLPVFEVDERYTSVAAQGEGARDLDAAAAALILEQYFREHS